LFVVVIEMANIVSSFWVYVIAAVVVVAVVVFFILF
jgi:hypothetical protein